MESACRSVSSGVCGTFQEFLQLPVVVMLQKNQVALYGAVLRSVLSGDAADEYFADGGAIVGWSASQFRGIVERDLYEYIKTVQVSEKRTAYSRIKYVLGNVDTGGPKRRDVALFLTYVGPAATPHWAASVNPSGPFAWIKGDLDVNLIQLDRGALTLRYVPPALEFHPCPLARVWGNIARRRFYPTAVVRSKSHENWVMERIDKLEAYGWVNAARRCRDVAADLAPGGPCAVCKEDREGKACVRLDCGHTFDNRCWQQVKKTAEGAHVPTVVRCPLCRERYSRWEC